MTEQTGHSEQASAPVELADGSGRVPVVDELPRMFEPPPVRLLTVDDAVLTAAAGLEQELDRFYVELLRLERADDAQRPIYRAANFSLRFEIVEPPVVRDDMRAIGIEVESLAEAEQKLIERETPYVLQKGLNPGWRTILLQDPAGNWIELSESRGLH